MRILVGDLFESQARTLVNAVNCVGVMGKGIAEQFKRRFPAMFDDYKRRCKRKDVRLGEPYLYRDSSGIQIVNFPTKGHWRSPSRLGRTWSMGSITWRSTPRNGRSLAWHFRRLDVAMADWSGPTSAR
jgi:hypothetical protein